MLQRSLCLSLAGCFFTVALERYFMLDVKKLESVAVSFDPSERSIRFESGEFYARLYVEGGRLLPESNAGGPAADPRDLSVRLMVAAVVGEAAVWANEPTEANADKVRAVADAFNRLMEADPQAAIDAALTQGFQVLRKALEKNREGRAELQVSGFPPNFLGKGDLSKFEFRPTTVSFEEHEGDKAVRITCGESSVLLTADKNSIGYAVGAVEETGPQEDQNGYNIRATFVALKDGFVKYLVMDELEQDLLEDAIQGWEDVKLGEPQKARRLLPALLSGEATMEVRRTTVPAEVAQELLDRHRRGELTDSDLIKAMTDERSDDAELH